MSEFRVQDKEPSSSTKKPTTTNNNNNNNIVVGSGFKGESFEGSPNKMMMMQHHNDNHHHHHRSSFHNDDSSVAGPTMPFSDGYSSLSAATIDGVSLNLQPFHSISSYNNITSATTTTLETPGEMGAVYPFTIAQWNELERQAMIYKYLMASLPIPSDLLSFMPTSSHSSSNGGGFNMKSSSSSNTDLEPGRCRRTDGKKWRCSRDVAPNHKYCERHMHRGRPRSRKPVELHTNYDNNNNNNNSHQIKKARHDSNPFHLPDVTLAIPNSTTRKYGSSSHSLASNTFHPYLQSSLSLDNNSFGVKTSSFVSSSKRPRGLGWMLNGDTISLAVCDSGWQPLMHNKIGMTTESSYHNNNTESHYLNSFPLYNNNNNTSELTQQQKPLPLFLNPLVVPMQTLQSEKPRGFTLFDAWPNTETLETNTNNNNASSSIGKLSLTSLDISMGGCVMSEENQEMSTVEMGLGFMEEPNENTSNDDDGNKIALSNWLNQETWVGSNSILGGPLAEVLRPSTVTTMSDPTTNSNPSSPATKLVESSGTLGTANAMVSSSPSGVLQNKTLASFSDSSGNSSPTVASSRTKLSKFN